MVKDRPSGTCSRIEETQSVKVDFLTPLLSSKSEVIFEFSIQKINNKVRNELDSPGRSQFHILVNSSLSHSQSKTTHCFGTLPYSRK